MSEHGVSSLNLHNYQKQVEASMTPYILEERELRVTQMDIFSRLMRDRILWVAGPVNDYMSVNTGMAASMGSVLLGAGTKGKRFSLKHSRTMLHQSSGGFSGNIQDAEVDMEEWKKINDELFILLGKYCGKKPEQVKKDATRDFWLTAEEAVKYGIIDEVVIKKKK